MEDEWKQTRRGAGAELWSVWRSSSGRVDDGSHQLISDNTWALFLGILQFDEKMPAEPKPVCANDSDLAQTGDCGGAFSLVQFDIISPSNNSHFSSRSLPAF